MKYLCLGYYDAAQMDARPAAEIEALMDQCRPHIVEFHDSGRVLADAGLYLESRCVRRVDGEIRIGDGRVVDSAYRIGSVSIIEAADMEEAVQTACLHPTARISEGEAFGWAIEVRPIHSFWPDSVLE
ncbi:YciI family protein [Sphingomonas koreensis]